MDLYVLQAGNLTITLTVSLIAYSVYRLVLYPRFFSPLRFVPGPPIEGLLLGHYPALVHSEAGDVQRDWTKQYGPAVRVVGPIGRERLIFLGPQALQKILVTDWVDYPRPRVMRNILGFSAGYGLLTVTGNEHKKMRKAMNPAFSIQNLMAQTELYYDSIDVLVKILKNELTTPDNVSSGKVLLVHEWMSKVTLDIICDTAFGYSSGSLLNSDNELAKAYEELTSLQSSRNVAVLIELLRIPGMATFLASDLCLRYCHLFELFRVLAPVKTFVDSVHRIRRISRQILGRRLEDNIAIDDPGKKDIMSLLVMARRGAARDGYRLSDEALVDQVLTFLGAGHETTASGLSWTLWLLANDTRVQDKLREEVSPVFADTERPDYRSLKDLKTLDCVIMESLRVLPPAPMTHRESQKADWIDGIFVPKGTLLCLPIRAINTWKDVWGPDAEEFRPERWLDLPDTYNSSLSLLSFLAGPHGCIGKTMAISEMKAVLSALIANFEFAPAYKGQLPQRTAAITMKPADNMPLLVTPIRR